MGKTRGPYEAEYPVGTIVCVASAAILAEFDAEWSGHNRLRPEQLQFANRCAKVKNVSFYHGADELYVLDGIPGIWHEACLRSDQI